jgi:hypothetical protein
VPVFFDLIRRAADNLLGRACRRVGHLSWLSRDHRHATSPPGPHTFDPVTAPFGLKPLPGVRTRPPVGTIVVFTGWAVCTTLYHLGATGLFLAVRRDPDALAEGQWWRVISPVLVQPDEVTTVIVLGVLALVFLAGALAGHVVGEWWQPYGSGVSVGFCGPLGALAVYALRTHRRRPGPQLVGPAVILAGAVVLAALADIHGPAILAGAVVGAVATRPVSDD